MEENKEKFVQKYISKSDIKKAPEFSKYTDFEFLGQGHNGVAYIAKHRFLNKKVVIKVYAIFENENTFKEKHLNEIYKNAEFRLSKEQAVVFDAGIINGKKNREFLYSIMEYIDGITLKEWLKLRDEYKENINGKKNNFGIYELKKIEINAALGFLIKCFSLQENDYREVISHGDLNSGNVMVLSQYGSRSDDKFLRCTRTYGDYIVPMNIEFIDYGTSRWQDTDENIGIENDLRFIYENTVNILSSFPLETFININEIKTFGEYLFKYYSRQILIVDLIRIIISCDFLDSFVPDLISTTEFQDDIIMWIFKVWYSEFKWEDKFEFNNFIDLSNWRIIKLPSKGGLIIEDNIVDYFNHKYSDIKFEFIKKFKKLKIISN